MISVRRKPRLKAKCPGCGLLAEPVKLDGVWGYECSTPSCEVIEFKVNHHDEQVEVKREARPGGVTCVPEYVEPVTKPIPCPNCGTMAERRAEGYKGKYVYQCDNPRCWVSRFKYNLYGEIYYKTRKTRQYYPTRKA
jgi:predicted RNA-binding Zn-ribbon protein involved in translation (DUF1610 family)